MEEVERLAERRWLWDRYQITKVDNMFKFRKELIKKYMIPG
jgi:hypothetical protein